MGSKTTKLTLSGTDVALVWTEREGYQLLIPKDDRTNIPEPALALCAAFAKLHHDPKFGPELAEWLKKMN